MDNSWSRKSHHLYSMSVLAKARGNSSLFDEDILMKQHLASISMILSSHKATPIVADLVEVRSLLILHGDTDYRLELVINVEFSGATKRICPGTDRQEKSRRTHFSRLIRQRQCGGHR